MKTRTLILALMLVMTSSHVMAQGRQNKEKQVEKTVMNNILTLYRNAVDTFVDPILENVKVWRKPILMLEWLHALLWLLWFAET